MEVFSIGHKVRFKLSKLEGIIGKISIYSNIYFELERRSTLSNKC